MRSEKANFKKFTLILLAWPSEWELWDYRDLCVHIYDLPACRILPDHIHTKQLSTLRVYCWCKAIVPTWKGCKHAVKHVCASASVSHASTREGDFYTGITAEENFTSPGMLLHILAHSAFEPSWSCTISWVPHFKLIVVNMADRWPVIINFS